MAQVSELERKKFYSFTNQRNGIPINTKFFLVKLSIIYFVLTVFVVVRIFMTIEVTARHVSVVLEHLH